MTTKTITYDDAKWQLVPKVSTEEIWSAINDARCRDIHCSELYDAALAAAPSPVEEVCEWEKVLSTDVTTYHAACDTQWRKRKEKYCPNCGKPIKEVTE